MKELIRKAKSMGVSAFRAHLADLLYSKHFANDPNENYFWLLIHLSVQAGNGHLRTDLHNIEQESPSWLPEESSLPQQLAKIQLEFVKNGVKNGLIGKLTSETSAADSLPVPRPPLLLSFDGQYLYFLRRRRQEDLFIAMLTSRSGAGTQPLPASENASLLATMIDSGKKLILLTGGPGTGKTTTVAKMLKLLSPSMQVLLTAPTGRAASRLAESIKGQSGRTLHGLLGMIPGRPPRHNAENPLEADLIVLDEASMVDLPMMNNLLQAMSANTTLLMVGDPDQLPSVEAGALLGDLLAGANQTNPGQGPLAGAILQLTKVYRSEQDVINAAQAVRLGDINNFYEAIDGKAVQLHPLPRIDEMADQLATLHRRHLGQSDTFMALSPLRASSWGVLALNQKISRIIGNTESPFNNMPIVVTRNDASRNLWNGDRALLKTTDGNIRAVLKNGDGSRELPLALLPAWEPAWIQTIHKSQGSEYDHVAIILPEGAEKLLSREIVYTAITRARHQVDIYAAPGVLEKSLERQVIRHSGIRRWAAGYTFFNKEA